MKRALLSTALCICLLLVACGKASAPADGPVMVAFGDSTTTMRASEDAKRWPNLVAKAKGWSMVDAGISETTLQNTVQNSVPSAGGPAQDNGRDTYQDRVLAHDPAWVLILYGLNDLRLDDPAFTSELYQNDLEEVIEGLIAGDVPADHIVVGSPPYMDPSHYASYSPWDGGSTPKHLAFVAAAATAAKNKRTRYVDVYRWMVHHGAESLIDSDGVHPNDRGHQEIANGFLSVLPAD
jgi:lysophospholipase L1-like esterase